MDGVFKTNLQAPPPHLARLDPNNILQQPNPDNKYTSSVADFTFFDIDPGVFSAELVNEKLYVKANVHGDSEAEYMGGNVTLGSYTGTQAAITHMYDRIERA